MTASIAIYDLINLPDAPAIPGLTFRHFRGESDYPHMLAVINGSKKADGIERSDTLEQLANGYAHLENCDPFQDMLIAEVDGQVIAYSRVFWAKQEDGTRSYTSFGFLLPEWRRKRIGTAMLNHGERRLCEIVATHPKDGPCYFQVFFVDETEKGMLALLDKAGYTPVRYGFSMKRDLYEPFPEAPMPEGLEVRPVEKEHLRAIFDADMEAFRDHWGHTPGTFERWQHNSSGRENFDPTLWFIAWDYDEIAGYSLCRYREEVGWVGTLGVRRPWRKMELGLALLQQSLGEFYKRGTKVVSLGVDAANPTGATRLYLKAGMHVASEFVIYEKELRPGREPGEDDEQAI